MKYFFFSILISIFFISQGVAQTELESLNERLNEIESKIKELEELEKEFAKLEKLSVLLKNQEEKLNSLDKSNKSLRQEIIRKDSIEFEKIKESILLALEGGDVLENEFKNIKDKLTLHPILVRLNKVNNPTSDALGFKFTDVIIDLSDEVFTNTLKGESLRRRWQDVVKKLVNNDVVKSVLGSNPITGLVSNVISTASTFLKSKVNNGKVTKIQEAFSESKIQEFVDKMDDFILFYDSLNSIGDEYLVSMNLIKQKNTDLDSLAKDFHLELLSILNIKNADNITLARQLDNSIVLERDDKGNWDYYSAINSKKVLLAIKHIEKFDRIKTELQSIKNDHNEALVKFLMSYKKQIEETNNIFKEVKGFDSNKTEALVNEINSYLKSKK
ncbi:MAG: hypothetical protein DWQ02_26545 [Bacteroidetes bacterium]|nr:MAG: hypothetical protein DWQ02_26545 [Bacteroidota bacterium]